MVLRRAASVFILSLFCFPAFSLKAFANESTTEQHRRIGQIIYRQKQESATTAVATTDTGKKGKELDKLIAENKKLQTEWEELTARHKRLLDQFEEQLRELDEVLGQLRRRGSHGL